jgi:RimJ/RimL family protein N-acetyltransferase
MELVPLRPPFLRSGLAGDWAAAGREISAIVPARVPDFSDVMELRLRQVMDDPALQPWLLRAMVLRDSRELIGHIGFHTAPGADYLKEWSPRAVEFGFEVFPPHRRQGLAREAAVAMMDWAHRNHSVPAFVLCIAPGNIPSQNLAAQLGFVRIGSHIDEIDGEEDVLERVIDADRPPPR